MCLEQSILNLIYTIMEWNALKGSKHFISKNNYAYNKKTVTINWVRNMCHNWAVYTRIFLLPLIGIKTLSNKKAEV